MNMNKKDEELTIEQETVRDCPLLYYMADKPMTETCMCWGWSFGSGWDNIVSDMSYRLEALNNMFYPKFKTRIQADQAKEKYGTLHFYWSVVIDPSPFKMWLKKTSYKLSRKLLNADFKMKKVVDKEPFDYEDVKEISKEEFERHLTYKASNEKLEAKDGKFIRTLSLHDYGKAHYEPTSHKLRYAIATKLKSLHYSIGSFAEPSSHAKAAVKLLEAKAQEIVRKAEEECSKVCEDCGHTIGTDWSPTCTTRRWITYICEDCAKKHKTEYYKNGALMKEGIVLKTTEEVLKAREEAEEKYREKQVKREQEAKQKMQEIENESKK